MFNPRPTHCVLKWVLRGYFLWINKVLDWFKLLCITYVTMVLLKNTKNMTKKTFISAVAFCFLSNVCIKPISTHSASAHHLKNCRLEIVALAFLSTSLRKTDAPVILMFFGWQFKTSPVWPSQSHSLDISRVVVSSRARHNWKCFLAYLIFKINFLRNFLKKF